jgi:hypothetical protein
LFLLLRRSLVKRIASAMIASTPPKPIPTPIPMLAPLERPDSPGAAPDAVVSVLAIDAVNEGCVDVELGVWVVGRVVAEAFVVADTGAIGA